VREVEALAAKYDLSQESCRYGMPLEGYQFLSIAGKRFLGPLLYRFAANRTGSISEAHTAASTYQELLRDAPGRWLFDQLPDHYKRGSLIQHFFYIDFDGADYVVRFKALDSVSTVKGRLYLPPGKHQVSMAGRMWDVAFYRHAIERIGQRLRTSVEPCFTQYMFQWSALSERQWVYEPVELADGQQGLRIRMIIEPASSISLWHITYVEELLKPEAGACGGAICESDHLPVSRLRKHTGASTARFAAFVEPNATSLCRSDQNGQLPSDLPWRWSRGDPVVSQKRSTSGVH
jgi:hypothetical protein